MQILDFALVPRPQKFVNDSLFYLITLNGKKNFWKKFRVVWNRVILSEVLVLEFEFFVGIRLRSKTGWSF